MSVEEKLRRLKKALELKLITPEEYNRLIFGSEKSGKGMVVIMGFKGLRSRKTDSKVDRLLKILYGE